MISLDTLVWIFTFFVVATPIIIFVLGLLVYFKVPQWRLYLGVGLFAFGWFELINYLQPIIAGASRDPSYEIPLFWYVVSPFQIATIFLGVFAFKNRIKGKRRLGSY